MTKKQGSSHEVEIIYGFNAPAERVFDAWLDPDLIAVWMFGPAVRDEEIVRISLDPEAGGKFSFVVRRQEQEIDHAGEYLEITRPSRLVFSWSVAGSGNSRVSVQIIPLENGSELKLKQELHPDWAEFADPVEAGWKKMLDALDMALRASD